MSQAGRYIAGSGRPPIETLTGNTGGPVGPDGAGNIDVPGNENINTVGNPGINTLFINLNETIHWPDTNGTGTTGVIYLGGAGGAGGQRFIHNFGAAGGSDENAFYGRNAGSFTATGLGNTGIGNQCMEVYSTGSSNTGVGSRALSDLDTGDGNVAIGNNSQSGNNTGDSNTTVGSSSGINLDVGSNNTYIGAFAASGVTITGSNNTALGANAGSAMTGAESDNIYVKNVGVLGENNTMRLGTQGAGASQVNRCFVAGITGVTTTNTSFVTINTVSGQLGETTTPIFLVPYTNVNTTPYVVLSTDQYLGVDCSGGAITIQLPNAPSTGRVFTIKDRTGSANTNNITVTTVGGVVLIDAAATYIMNTQYAAINVIFNGTNYEIY